MFKGIRWRVITILVITALSILGIMPLNEKIHLGLDLKGGMHIVLQVNMDDAIKASRDNDLRTIKKWLSDKGIAHFFIVQGSGPDAFEITTTEGFMPAETTAAFNQLSDYLRKTFSNKWTIQVNGNTLTSTMKAEFLANLRAKTTEQAIETIRRRVDEYGLAEVVVAPQGAQSDRIMVQLPGVEDPQQVKNLIKETAFLEFRLVYDVDSSAEQLQARYAGKMPAGAEILPGETDQTATGNQLYYLVAGDAVVTGQDLEFANPCPDRMGQPAVCFRLGAAGSRRFSDFTGANIGNKLGIILDRRVLTAPVVRAQIGAEGIIEGIGSQAEANKLSIQLRSGALPASLSSLEERQIGPTLGRESIQQGTYAAVAGLIIVMVFMLIYYRLSGLNADLALVLNVLLILAGLAYFGASLTLPGIAGVVLTIGMSVDANVLVFERIREELRLGKTVRAAVDQGFARAFTTIVDANVTTLLAALALYIWGSGPVKGFAITLTMGIIASMFTAIFVSRTLFELYFNVRKVEKLSI